MRNRSESTAPAVPAAVPAATPPIIEPERWEEFPAFRETFLLQYSGAAHNAALRALGLALFEIALEAGGSPVFPSLPGRYKRHELAAAAGDLRHLQGFLRMVATDDGEAEGGDAEGAGAVRLARLAGRLAPRVAKVAAALEEAVRLEG